MNNKRNRHQDILRAAKKLFAKLGYHQTSITKIIKEASIARGTFYLYFSSKREVFAEIVDEALESIISNMKPVSTDPVPDYESVMRQLRINLAHALHPLLKDINLSRIFVSQAEGLDTDAANKLCGFYKYLTDWLEESLDEGKELGIVRRCNSRITSISLLGMLKGVIWSYAVGGEKMDYHEVVEEITANIAEGIILN
ncbi:MAG: TetR/AcrR family transcriptional regulator [Deltaproteobacteria bacterium]|jgi:AcrR family transcriptional regulator|nr:TetR/AcrR family transcriptional regulator [Deltaproteobacteria bacterium]